MNPMPDILRDATMHEKTRSLRRPSQHTESAPAVLSSVGGDKTRYPHDNPALLVEPLLPVASMEHLQAQERAEFERGLSVGREQGVQEGVEKMQHEIEHLAQLLATSLAEEKIQQAQAHFQREANLQIAQLHAQLTPQYELLTSLLRRVPQEIERRLADAEDDIVALAFEVICRVAGERAVTQDGLVGQVKAAAQSWHGRSALEVHIHPEDLEMLQIQGNVTEKSTLEGHVAGGPALRWVADSKVVMGGCLLQSAEGALDARLELQMEVLRNSLLRTRAERKRNLGSEAPEVAK